MFVGGFQHPPNIDAARWFVESIFPLIRAQKPELRFHLIGSKATPEVQALGAAPGVKGKINMSMSYGQPVVATPMAVEGMHLHAGRDVLVAEEPEDFAAAVLQLYDDAALWQQLSQNGLDNVRRHFGFDSARAALQTLLRNGAA
jgi:hypothetical protein